MTNTSSPFLVKEIQTNEFTGIVRDLHITKQPYKYGNIQATFTLGFMDNAGKESPPVTINFPDLRGFGADECPIKLEDLLKVKITVERLEPNGKR